MCLAFGTFAWRQTDRVGARIVTRTIAFCVTASSVILSLSACTNPYDPAQRFVGGGLLGAGSGTAIGLRLAADPWPRLAGPQVPLEASRPRHHRTATTLDTLAIIRVPSYCGYPSYYQ
jgi:hypothetical protein